MVTKKTIIELSRMIYSNKLLDKDRLKLVINNQSLYFNIIGKVNTANYLLGGLEAIVLEIEDNLIFVIRGADVGIGADIFKILSANDKFIPVTREKKRVRATFQDWFWNVFFGSFGLVPFSQYLDFKDFFVEISSKFSNKNILLVGHSLGGEIAQRLSVESNVEAITFSAVSPWWSFGHEQRKAIRNGTLTDGKITNYYSRRDPFRYFPLFARRLGIQREVKLKRFSSTSSLIAMLLERVYWAHGLNYYTFDLEGEIEVMHSESNFERILKNLNQQTTSTIWIDIAIFASGILPSIILWLTSQVMLQRVLPEYSVSTLNVMLLIVISLAIIVTSALYMLPTLIIHSKWKYVIWGINVFFSWTGIGWVFLLVASFVLNSISIKK